MPTLDDLRSRFAKPTVSWNQPADSVDEDLVRDTRAVMTPAECVEQKLDRAMRATCSFAATTTEQAHRQKPR